MRRSLLGAIGVLLLLHACSSYDRVDDARDATDSGVTVAIDAPGEGGATDDASPVPEPSPDAGTDADTLLVQTLTFGERLDAMFQSVTTDTFIREAEPTTNFGGATALQVDSDPGAAIYALLRFDLSRIPMGSHVQSATLRVVTRHGAGCESNEPIEVYQLLEPWTEGTAVSDAGAASFKERMPGTKWTTLGAGPPGSRGMASETSVTMPARDTEYAIPLQRLVQLWVEAPAMNNGIIMVSGVNTGDGACFSSAQDPQPSVRPLLRVVVGP